MQKSGLIVIGSQEHVRLQRFIGWACVKMPDFTMKSSHNPDWCHQYAVKGDSIVARAAKAFQLGMWAETIDQALSDGSQGLLASILNGNTDEFSFKMDLFGVEKTFKFGSIQHLLKPQWAMRFPALQRHDQFEDNVKEALQDYIIDKLSLLESVFQGKSQAEMSAMLAGLTKVIDVEEFASRKIQALNEDLHELQYVVKLGHQGFALDMQRKIQARHDHLFTADEVTSLKQSDQVDLEAKFQVAFDEAGDFDLAQLGQKHIAEILTMQPKRIRKVIAAAKASHNEKMAFAALLKDPKFTEYHRLYPARGITRDWTAFLGPTNSGKTHNAIGAMAKAKRGIYLSPLRLMALENQERIESMGVPCSLVTGEEQIIREGAEHFCCTVEEFARFRSQHWDVVVIDEVQLLADPKRGWAWVDALVSANTPTLMMTGPALIEPSLSTLAAICGDNLKIVETKRLSPISVAKHPAAIKDLQKGALVVAFSRRTVLELKGLLEASGRTVSVVYGALSPEVRREQARRFRDGESEIMVATDAVGMGLNLPAHTVCFYSDEKFDGVQHRQLNVQEVKQIGGRAGRYGMAEDGLITAFENKTLKSIRALFQQDDLPVDLSQFQIRPSFEHLESICEELNEDSLLSSWQIFIRNINFGKEFVAVLPDELAEWLDLIDDPAFPLALRWIFACTPVRGGVESLAAQYAMRWIGKICDRKTISLPTVALKSELSSMEVNLHIIETYIHLARSLPEFFPDAETAEEQRITLNDSITQALSRRRAPSKSDKRILGGNSNQCEKCNMPMPLLSLGHRYCQTCWAPAA